MWPGVSWLACPNEQKGSQEAVKSIFQTSLAFETERRQARKKSSFLHKNYKRFKNKRSAKKNIFQMPACLTASFPPRRVIKTSWQGEVLFILVRVVFAALTPSAVGRMPWQPACFYWTLEEFLALPNRAGSCSGWLQPRAQPALSESSLFYCSFNGGACRPRHWGGCHSSQLFQITTFSSFHHTKAELGLSPPPPPILFSCWNVSLIKW